MSAKLGTLTLDLIAKIGGFTQPVKEAEKQTKVSFDSMRKHVNTYATAAVAGAVAVGSGVLAMAAQYATAARELQTFAQISNATTQEFQSMSVGAETMGVTQEKLADQLKDFNEKLGEFITIGSGGAVDFFEQIAVKTEGSAEGARKLALEMQNLSGPKALQLYVDKLEEAGVTQQQMSFYLESMASDTTNLIPLLKNGGEGFKFWADAAERAGVIMDEHAIAKANELSVQMDLLNLQVKGAKNQFIQGLMPALVSVGNSMTDATTDTNLLSDAGVTLGNVFIGVAATGMGVYAVIKMLSNSIAGLAVEAVNSKKMVDKAAENQGFFANLPGVKITRALILGAANARTNENSAVQMAAQDNAKLANDIGTTINEMFSNTVSESVKAMTDLRNSQQGVISGSDEWIKKQNESTKAAKENNKALQEQNRILEQQKRDREQISKAYASDYQNLIWDENEQIDLVKGSGFSQTEQDKYLSLVEKRFTAERAAYFKNLNLEINQFKWSEEKKLEYAYQMDREIAENDVKIADAVRAAKLQFLDEQYAIELQKARFHSQNMAQVMRDSIKSLSYGADDIFAQATMSESDYARWSLENDRSNAQSGLKNDRVKVEQDIMTSDQYQTEDERYAALLEAHQEYRDGMAAIDVDYHKQVKDLEREEQQSRLSDYGTLLSQASAVFGTMTQMVKDATGEQSAAYKTMFLMQQTIAVGQAIISTELAAAKALEMGPILGIPAASLVRGLGYASVGLIAAQTISGMAHHGIDSIPKEGTWLLDKGERVVDSRTNADLKNYLSNKGSGGGDVNISQSITFADGGAKVDTQGQKELARGFQNMMDAFVRKEMRQGGLIYNFLKGR